MYLDFEAGRLKLLGTLAFPKARYLVLRPGPNEHVLCEDVFESVIGAWQCRSNSPGVSLCC